MKHIHVIPTGNHVTKVRDVRIIQKGMFHNTWDDIAAWYKLAFNVNGQMSS